MNLTRDNWASGWNPATDEINGDPKSLVQMENLCLDTDGSISLVKGTKVASGPYSDIPIGIYTTVSGGRKYRYTALQNGDIWRHDSVNPNDNVVNIGPGGHVCFGNAWGETLICGPGIGNRYKDNLNEASPDIRSLGLPTFPDPPSLTRHEQQSVMLEGVDGSGNYTSWTCEEGENLVNTDSYAKADSLDADPYRIVLQRKDLTIDATNFPEGRSDLMDEDTFLMKVQISDSQNIEWIRVEIWLEDPLTGGNYFYTEWQNDENTPLNQGIDVWSTLSRRRGDFGREGSNSALWWYDVKAIKVIFKGSEFIYATCTELMFQGGAKGILKGVYKYCSVVVYNSGKYLSKSPQGPETEAFVITNGCVDIWPSAPPYYAESGVEVWVFRRSTYNEEYSAFPLGLLDQWYHVLTWTSDEIEAGTVKTDNMSDVDALKMETLNEWLQTVQNIPEDPYCILGPIYDRILYMGLYSIYIGDVLNPDAVDLRYTIKMSGTVGEKNLFLCKLSEGVILVATTKDFYLITGDFSILSDGTLNLSVKPIGEAHPAISEQFAQESGLVFYMASDGWRSTNGSYSATIVAQLDPIFGGGEEKYGMGPVSIVPDNNGLYGCAIGKGRLFTSVPFSTSNSQGYQRMVFIYHLVKGYWYCMLTDANILYTEPDGTVLATYTWGSGTYVRELYVGTLLDETEGHKFTFRTIFDANQQPRNRKEPFTLKVTMDSGNKPVDIYIAEDNQSFIHLGSFSFDGPSEEIIDIAPYLTLGFRFALMITGSDIEVLSIKNFTIEYDPRPEQLTSLRIPYDNLGTPSRKRIVNYPLVIDCLGNNTVLTPYVDGVAKTTSIINLDRKGTHTHYFKEETIGVDIGAYLRGGPFEYYGVDTEEIVSEKLPNPVKYLVIPASDYGNPNRKRHSSYKFQINTRGYSVRFTPVIDGVSYAPLDFSTDDKRTVQYYFSVDTIGIDIGGILETIEDEEFEFYGTIVPQHLEVLPPMLKEYWIPETNFGIPAPKRIRTLPMVLNTNGYPVTFTPVVDGTRGTPSILTTGTKRTTAHYFDTDIFGTDFAGEVVGDNYFEFYELLKPEAVEVLPVAKKFDQIGPVRFDSIGKLLAFRLRLIPTATESLPLKIFSNTEMTYPDSNSIPSLYTPPSILVQGGLDEVYEVELPKTISGTVFRFEIGPLSYPFHRYDFQIKVNLSGVNQSPHWVKV